METMTIFKYRRDPKDFSKILDKIILRIITVHESFIGFGEKGAVNRSEFVKLANTLEPSNDGIILG